MYVLSWLALVLCAIPGIRGAVRAAKEPPDTRCAGAVIGLITITLIMLALGFLLLQTHNLY